MIFKVALWLMTIPALLLSIGNEYIPVWVALVSGLPSIVAAILGYMNKRSISITAQHVVETKERMKTLEDNTNCKMDKLLEVSNKAEFAKGLLEGKEKHENSKD